MKTAADFNDRRRWFQLSSNDFALLNPNTRTCALFRTERDAELTKKLYRRVPILISDSAPPPEKNPWGLSFMTLFHMASDSGLFLEARSDDALPLYEAKMIHQFDHRWATYGTEAADEESARDATPAEKANPDFAVHPRYWLPRESVKRRVARAPDALLDAVAHQDEEVAAQVIGQWFAGYYLNHGDEKRGNHLLLRSTGGGGSLNEVGLSWLAVKSVEQKFPLTPADEALLQTCSTSLEMAQALIDAKTPGWLMGWRDICRATDERTVIAAVMPVAAVGHTVPLMVSTQTTLNQALLLANLNCLVLDFVARQKVGGTHLTYGYLRQFPILAPASYSERDRTFINERVLELTYTACDMALWARDLGYDDPPFGWDPDRRALLRAELDANYARLYGLTRDELRYILDPADVMGPDYPSETFRVLKDNEMRAHGEYRTRRLVLEAWDRMFGD